MEWQKLENIEVGTNRFADGEWRVTEDETEIKLELNTDGLHTTFTVSPGIHPDGYETLAILLLKAVHSVQSR